MAQRTHMNSSFAAVSYTFSDGERSMEALKLPPDEDAVEGEEEGEVAIVVRGPPCRMWEWKGAKVEVEGTLQNRSRNEMYGTVLDTSAPESGNIRELHEIFGH